MNKRLPKGFAYIADKGLYKLSFTYDKKRFAVYGQTQKECEAKKAEREELLKDRMHIDNQNITLSKYFDIWIIEQSKEVKDSTVYNYKKSWKHLEKHLGKRKLAELNKLDVLQMQDKMMKDSTPNNVNRVTRLLKQILNSAINDRIINYNPCNSVKRLKDSKPKAVNTIHRALTENETRLFFQNATECHYYNLLRFLLITGCRIGEATALHWFDISFDRKEIYIKRTVSKVSNKEYRLSDSPKTSSSNRIIPLTDELKEILQKQKAQNSFLFGKGCSIVFPNSKGTLAYYNTVNACIANIIDNINHPKEKDENGEMKPRKVSLNLIQPFSAHAFRDTFATRCIEQGMQPNTLKALLGHSSLKMTMDLYAHVMPNTKQQELEKIKFAM